MMKKMVIRSGLLIFLGLAPSAHAWMIEHNALVWFCSGTGMAHARCTSTYEVDFNNPVEDYATNCRLTRNGFLVKHNDDVIDPIIGNITITTGLNSVLISGAFYCNYNKGKFRDSIFGIKTALSGNTPATYCKNYIRRGRGNPD
jgi:hypothetical protein